MSESVVSYNHSKGITYRPPGRKGNRKMKRNNKIVHCAGCSNRKTLERNALDILTCGDIDFEEALAIVEEASIKELVDFINN